MVKTETSKLRALRSKTDQQLMELVSRNLELARDAGRDAASRKHAYSELQRLLPLMLRIDRRRLEPLIEELAEVLYPPTKTAACF
jgi:hypothetical protein